jgi:hypothetical protein
MVSGSRKSSGLQQNQLFCRKENRILSCIWQQSLYEIPPAIKAKFFSRLLPGFIGKLGFKDVPLIEDTAGPFIKYAFVPMLTIMSPFSQMKFRTTTPGLENFPNLPRQNAP